MKQPLTGRADLLLALVEGHGEAASALIRHLDFERVELKQPEVPTPPATGARSRERQPVQIEPSVAPDSLPIMPFWHVVGSEIYDDNPEASPQKQQNLKLPEWPPQPEPPMPPLASWQSTEPRLHRELDSSVFSGRLDIRKTIQRLSRAELLSHFPRQRRRRWGCEVQVILDRSTAMIPFWQDQIRLCAELERLFPANAVQYAIYRRGEIEPLMDEGDDPTYRLPHPGSLVIAVGDLGMLASQREQEQWRRLGLRLQQQQCRTLALVPTSIGNAPAMLKRHWRMLGWEHARSVELELDQMDIHLRRLLVLISPASRIEPGFMRQVRRLIGADAAVEALLWEHPLMIGKSSAGGTLEPQARQALHHQFSLLDAPLQRGVLALLRDWRTHLPQEIWYIEILGLPEGCHPHLPLAADLVDACRFVDSIAGTRSSGTRDQAIDHWVRRLEQDEAEAFWANHALKPSLQRLWASAHRDDPQAVPPIPDYDPKFTPPDPTLPVKRLHLFQYGNVLHVTNGDKPAGSWLGEIRSRTGEIALQPIEPFWQSGKPPTWADAWGEDAFGRWVEFVVADVRQRMRWMPAGAFLMGSPEDEAERYGDEGPQHAVRISQGFWMFDTAVPQGLWVAVMGENPSYFKGDDLPVEQVSWEDCHQFIGKLNDRLHGLDLDLPSEAQWEYACRAGTNTPFHFGDQITTEQVNYDGNNPYAGGEKGKYRGKTLPVQKFDRNHWGLYQMHGNVWEWCLDGQRDYQEARVVDPLGPQDGVSRALRGGGWNDGARDVRSADRSAYSPGGRSHGIGFRCARVQVKSSPVAEPIEPGQLRSGTRSADPDQSGGAGATEKDKRKSTRRTIIEGGSGVLHVPPGGDFELRSDMGRLRVQQLQCEQPGWASGMGRDRFGLWADFKVGKGREAVRQRMRWIPPGQFMMGSQEDEPERGDNEKRHLVTINKGYWLFDSAVQQLLWNHVMGKNPSSFKGDELPVDSVSWNDAHAFMEKLNGMVDGLNLCLPSEAQWEYACRAGTTTPFHFGEQITPERANYNGNYPYADGQKGEYRKKTVPVKSFVPNDWGLWQMHGNVWEWCLDGRRKYGEEPISDPLGSQEDGVSRALRGGGWHGHARYVRSASRPASSPDDRDHGIGFRCARVQDAER